MQAFTGADIFDGTIRRRDHALLVQGGKIARIVGVQDIPQPSRITALDGGLISAGFVDVQVNGGGGVQFNECPSVETLRRIAVAHLQFGTTSLLPTLITDSLEVMAKACEAARQATLQKIPGIIGLHLEGPHLSVARKGAHEAKFIHPMSDQDCETLTHLAHHLPNLLLTVAPENTRNSQIRQLSAAGAVVSLGHSDTDYHSARAAAEAGASSVTHLFNAMSPFQGRAPGMVGAALNLPGLSAGLIADGIHVSVPAIQTALAAKRGPGRIYLVTDAMATLGSDLQEFQLGGRRILRQKGRLTLADGTLAGADLDMISAVRFMVQQVGVTPEQALCMASLYPAQLLGKSQQIGQLVPGANADFIHLGDDLHIRNVWQNGQLLSR
ncbi:MAG: N-acetylglucosamine-6-phosphate deacetylase [Rhodobacterales bacterium]|nr:MAG: N-acetylglucosamine-6-phosphate deacetylase [Rhodobacterales bacterium]